MVRAISVFGMCAVLVTLSACDAKEEEKPKYESRSLSDLDQNQAVSDEEAAANRKAAGIKSDEEIAAENAAFFEKGAKEYIKTRLVEYRALVAELRAMVDDVEKAAPGWNDKSWEKYSEKHKERAKKFFKTYMKLTGNGAEGGETQVSLGKAVRTWEDVDGALGPGVADKEEFTGGLKTIREELDKVDKAFEAIEKDESLKADEKYVPAKEGADDDEGEEEEEE